MPGDRGNVYDRRRRRLWVLAAFGDGRTCACTWCGTELDYVSLEVDRFPICGHDGGAYRRDNVVPACATCNRGRCSGCAGLKSPHRPSWWSREGREGVGLRTALRRQKTALRGEHRKGGRAERQRAANP